MVHTISLQTEIAQIFNFEDPTAVFSSILLILLVVITIVYAISAILFLTTSKFNKHDSPSYAAYLLLAYFVLFFLYVNTKF